MIPKNNDNLFEFEDVTLFRASLFLVWSQLYSKLYITDLEKLLLITLKELDIL